MSSRVWVCLKTPDELKPWYPFTLVRISRYHPNYNKKMRIYIKLHFLDKYSVWKDCSQLNLTRNVSYPFLP